MYVLAEWKLADRDYSGKLSFNEILKLLKKLNIGMKPGMIRERFRVCTLSLLLLFISSTSHSPFVPC